MRRKRKNTYPKRGGSMSWPLQFALRASIGLSAVAALALLVGYGPVEAGAGRLLQVETPSQAGAGTTAAAPGAPASSAAAPAPADLSLADRDLVTRVRLAGLWEIPAGRMAAKKGVNPRVRQVGAQISSQHERLNALVVAAAQRLNVILPDEPNADQQSWLQEMQLARGEQFDQVFVDRLRVAHGKIFPAVAAVRVSTLDPVVRGLASNANDFVLQHLTLLESTKLVDYERLPAPADAGAPSLADYRPRAPARGQPARFTAAWILLALAAVTGLLGLLRLAAPRLFGHGRRPAPHNAPSPWAMDELPRDPAAAFAERRAFRADQFS